MRENFNTELKNALKAKDIVAIRTIRLILAAVKDRDIVVRGSGESGGINENDIISLLKKMIKQREESIILYKKGKRFDLVKNEEEEIIIISKFLPEQLSERETLEIVKKTINEIKATSIKDMGKVMLHLKEHYESNMDFSFASKMIKDILLKWLAKKFGIVICKKMLETK